MKTPITYSLIKKSQLPKGNWDLIKTSQLISSRYSTVTLFARLRGLSTSMPFAVPT